MMIIVIQNTVVVGNLYEQHFNKENAGSDKMCPFHSARRQRTSRGRPHLGPYVSFPDVLIRRGRRKNIVSTFRQNRTYE